MRIEYDEAFDPMVSSDELERSDSAVFQVFPDMYRDKRGHFQEVIRLDESAMENCTGNDTLPKWLWRNGWIRQINRSSSKPGVVRGCHAQMGMARQGKLVEALTETVYDIITDARIDSSTFGSSSVYRLDPEVHNQLWVPHGFLHAICIPFSAKSEAIVQYCVDYPFAKNAEICIKPESLLTDVVLNLARTEAGKTGFDDLYELFEGDWNVSDKDMVGIDYSDFIAQEVKNRRDGIAPWYMNFEKEIKR